MKLDELYEKSEEIFNYILEECTDEERNVDKDLLDCLVDRLKSIKDKLLTIEESHKLTIDEIQKQLKTFKKTNVIEVPDIDYVD